MSILDDKKEVELKKNFFTSKSELQKYLFKKFYKYYDKPIQLKKHLKHKGPRIGWYAGYDIPTFMNHGRLHWVELGSTKYYLCESEFEIYKKKIKNKHGNYVHYVDVKCPSCKHISVENMQYLVWKMNCKNCKGTITVNDRVKKTKFNMADFR